MCWQSPALNPWMSKLALEVRDALPRADRVRPEQPGPFSFADPERTHDIVRVGRWMDVSVEPSRARRCTRLGTDDFDVAVEGSLSIGGAARMLENGTPEQRAEARVMAERIMRSFWGDGGAFIDGACWLVTAQRPATG